MFLNLASKMEEGKLRNLQSGTYSTEDTSESTFLSVEDFIQPAAGQSETSPMAKNSDVLIDTTVSTVEKKMEIKVLQFNFQKSMLLIQKIQME